MKSTFEGFRVVIPTWNRGEVVIECLENLNSQTILPGEVIIVDDGSDDDTEALVGTWSSNNLSLNVKYIKQNNQGPAAARNHGCNISKCEWLAFQDSDDLWPYDFIERAMSNIERGSEFDCFLFDVEDQYYSGDVVVRVDYRCNAKYQGATVTALYSSGYPGTNALVAKWSLFQKAGGFPLFTNYAEDLMLFLKLGFIGKWKYCDGKPAYRRLLDRPEGSLRRRPKFERDLRNALTFISAYRWAKTQGIEAPEVHPLLFRRFLMVDAGLISLRRRRPDGYSDFRKAILPLGIKYWFCFLKRLTELVVRRLFLRDRLVDVDPSPYFKLK